ncbi:uncharacterized protein LOC122059071 [Macadamia integrifolia]|uniref:uncharacterized protein LOC122059071 n=1 Tax=Macadamia integrifolia TaxID=60698 RepID=UPI001C53056A|nr:uncharacterized protein LOC122059071 [Macadamia integrifolia]
MVDVGDFPCLLFNRLGLDVNFVYNHYANKIPNIWVIWKRHLAAPVIISETDQQVTLRWCWQQQEIYVSCIYANCFRALRRELWTDLVASGPQVPAPWMIVGDFNAILESHEKRGPGAFNVGPAAEYGPMVDACSMIPVPSHGRKFTWSNNRRRGNVVVVLDRSFYNDSWVWIRGSPIFVLSKKLKRLKPILKNWSIEKFPNFDVRLEESRKCLVEIQEKIERDGLDDILFSREVEAKSEYQAALDNYEKLGGEKSRIRWMKEGDRNSKFFHLSIKMRKIKNSISSLTKFDGTIVSDPEQMEEFVADYFESFHKTSPVVDHLDLLDAIPRVLDVDVMMLKLIPRDTGIKFAEWELDPDSSPGPDGFSGAFYKKCWEVIGQDFCNAVKEFFSSDHMPNGVNNCFLVLIPKVDGVVPLDKFRPLCMGNFFVKLISKIMALRLSRLLPRFISEEQGAFQKGKVIQSNIGLASEMVNLMFFAARGSLGIKVDIQKAYDTISWGFIFQVLRRFGFPEQWITWLHQILVTNRISILFNGDPVGFFGMERGLRQGDPISPMIFIIAKEVLYRGLQKLLSERKITSLQGPCGAHVPGHILFADDIFIFTNASARNVRNLHSFLNRYQEFSGQKFNLEKSKLFMGRIPIDRRNQISGILGIMVCNFPTKYLGVEIFKGRVKKEVLLPVMDKVKNRLAGGKGRCSMARRVESVMSVISGEIDTTNRLQSNGTSNGDLKKGYKASSIWPSVRRMWSFVGDKKRWIVGNGQSINFWKDRWWGSESIVEKVQGLDDIFQTTNARVGDFISNFEWQILEARSNLLKDVFNRIRGIKLPHYAMVDHCVWSLTTSREFSSCSAWKDIRARNRKAPWKSTIWFKRLLPRLFTFGWRIVHEKLSTNDLIRKRGNPGRVGAGAVLRNHLGQVVCSFYIYLGVKPIFEAKFVALVEGVARAKEIQTTALWIESDSVAMEVNPVADYLAKQAAKTGGSRDMMRFPFHVNEKITNDAMDHPKFRFNLSQVLLFLLMAMPKVGRD